MANERVRIIVRGRVQGVFFRAATREVAVKLGLTGWVRNRDDGAVEVVAEGEGKSLRELVKWARRGPGDAAVSLVETDWGEYLDEFDKFKIEYY